MQWIKVGISLNCNDAYSVLEWANNMKLDVFASKHEGNIYYEHLIRSADDCVLIRTKIQTQEL